ncbi:MAG: hypothetical protein P1U85_03025 [Verrucomicrobiales bacterium]|jgi:hypothetical protein|nr:hypothetical protein [Verrucomicrobiales bacterium]
MKKAILVAIIGAMTLGVNAGDWGKAPVPAKAPIEECVDIGGSISAGYMTDYVFYGVRFARDSVWTDVNYTFDNLIVPINVGAWYLNGITPAGVDELDLYVSAELGTYYGFDVSLGYTHYFFPEVAGLGSYGEIGLDISRSFSIVDFAWETNYAFTERNTVPVASTGGGWYHQASLSKTFGITDAVSLVITGGAGWTNGYWNSGYAGLVGVANGPGGTLTRGNGFSHYFVTAELPIELNCRATLTPYISYNGTPTGSVVNNISTVAGGSSDVLSGGVSLSVSF